VAGPSNRRCSTGLAIHEFPGDLILALCTCMSTGICESIGTPVCTYGRRCAAGGMAGPAEAGVTSGGFGIAIVTWPGARMAEAARYRAAGLRY